MQKEEYDVLRLIEHNQICYVSSECQKGYLLPRWLKYHPRIQKEEMLFIIRSIVKQLEGIHRCRNNPCYQYVNPYSILRSEEGKIYFLDMNAKDNLKQLRIVQRRTIREHFLPEEEPYYQKASVELDIYGLGKTIQYLLSQTEIEPALTRTEERKFQKVISKCLNRHSKKSFQNISEIQKMIPKYERSESKKGKRKKKFLLLAVCVTVVCAGIFVTGILGQRENRAKELQNAQKTAQETKQEEQRQREQYKEELREEKQLNLELGRIYFLELQDYKKSREVFKSVKGDVLAESMAMIAECISEGRRDDTLRDALESAEQKLLQEKTDEQEKQKEWAEYYRCILKGYSFLDSEEDAKNVLRIGEICLNQDDTENKAEIIGVMATAYEEMNEFTEAGAMYEEQIKYEEEKEEKEKLYQKAAIVYEQAGQKEQALSVCRSGIREYSESSELRIMYMKILLKDSNVDRAVCIQNIKEQITECPELKKQEEFQKLIKEHGIVVKGEKVWEKGAE